VLTCVGVIRMISCVLAWDWCCCGTDYWLLSCLNWRCFTTFLATRWTGSLATRGTTPAVRDSHTTQLSHSQLDCCKALRYLVLVCAFAAGCIACSCSSNADNETMSYIAGVLRPHGIGLGISINSGCERAAYVDGAAPSCCPAYRNVPWAAVLTDMGTYSPGQLRTVGGTGNDNMGWSKNGTRVGCFR
jgi:hypothetical protein